MSIVWLEVWIVAQAPFHFVDCGQHAADNMSAKVDGLKTQGVEFKVCANTLNGRKVDYENELYDVSQADIVPSGVAELSHLQSQGLYLYKAVKI